MATAIAEPDLARTWARHAIFRAVRIAGPRGISSTEFADVRVPRRSRAIPAVDRVAILAELVAEGLVVERIEGSSYHPHNPSRVYVLAELAEEA